MGLSWGEQEFGVSSLMIHQTQCVKKREAQQGQLPANAQVGVRVLAFGWWQGGGEGWAC